MAIKKKVAIVGAGISGLQVAKDLIDSGMLRPRDIIVLEARNRVGGRINTVPCSIAPSRGENGSSRARRFFYDEGARWVHGTSPAKDERGDECENPVLALVRSRSRGLDEICIGGNVWTRPRDALVAAPTEKADTTKDQPGIVFFVDGSCPSSKSIERAVKKYEEQMRSVAKVGAAAYEMGEGMANVQISLANTLNVIKDRIREKEGSATKESKRRTTTADCLSDFCVHLLEHWHACSSSQLQLNDFAGEDVHSDCCDVPQDCGGFPGPHRTVKRGMASLFPPLLKGVEECIFYEQEVDTISYDADDGKKKIKVRCKSCISVEADACVITIPLGCLKDKVKSEDDGMFRPKLSADKTKGIEALGVGSYKKVWLVFDTIFWPKDVPLIGLVSQNHNTTGHGQSFEQCICDVDIGNRLLLYNLWAKHGLPVLEAALVGSAAERIKGKPDCLIREAVLGLMRDAMGKTMSGARCVGFHVTRWEEDEFSRGAYSNMILGSLPRHCQALGAPEWDGRLVFAGEATDFEYQGSVHGALRSGKRAAGEVLSLLSSLAQTH